MKKEKPQDMKKLSQKKLKGKITDTIKMINPFSKKTIELGPGIDLKVKAKFNPIKEKASLSLQFDQILDNDVEVTVKLNGAVTSLESLQGNSAFTCSAVATKKF